MSPSPARPPVRVAIVNDYPLVVAGVQAMLLPYEHRVRVVETQTGRLPQAGEVDVVVFDPFGRVDLRARLTELLSAGDAKVLVYSWAPTPDLIATEVRRGAVGFLPKTASGERLVRTLEGLAYDAGRPAGQPRSDHEATEAWPGQDEGLTAREAEILGLIMAGMSNQEIAAHLHLSINSVKTHIRLAYRRMDVERRPQAILWGLRHGMNCSKVSPVEGSDL